ncbi:MAG: RNA ligase family protein [Oligoflexales bacterium]
MEFISYPKISESPAAQTKGGKWIAQEKIHGAHLVVGVDPNEVVIGKRKIWLSNDDVFFGWQLLRSRLTEIARSFFNSCYREIKSMYLYGEIFGGSYNHTEVYPVPGISPIQTGTNYCPELNWAVFDVAICTSNNEVFFCPFHWLDKTAKNFEVMQPPLLGTGTKSELQNLPSRYLSKVAKVLGLPEIKNNFAEGFVLKQADEVSFHGRQAIKHKIPEFSDSIYNQSIAFNPNQVLSVEQICKHIPQLATPIRINSARSKVGEKKIDIFAESILDIMTDLEEVFPQSFATIDLEQCSFIEQEILTYLRTRSNYQ